MRTEKNYLTPAVKFTSVALEEGIAQVRTSSNVQIQNDWRDGGEVGTNPAVDGGDIHLDF
jgi:adenosylcobinamide amidohydrolase